MRRTLLATLVAASTLLAACGDDGGGEDAATTTPATSPTTAAAATTAPATPPAAPASMPPTAPASTPAPSAAPGSSPAGDGPQRIVSISPVHTEILFALGAGDQVVAVDSLSTYPPEAAGVLTDLSAYEPSIEAIAGYEPDLVVAAADTGRDQLEALGIDMWVADAPTSREGAYEQMRDLGTITGHATEAEELIASIQSDIGAVLADVPVFEVAPRVYHELDDTYYSADSTTFIGSVYTDFGLENIADRAEGDHGGYPQLNAEAIISADPDLIVLADTLCCATTAATVSARDGWQAITAVANGAIVELNDDVASRWGPRMVDFYRDVAAAIDEHLAAPVATSGG